MLHRVIVREGGLEGVEGKDIIVIVQQIPLDPIPKGRHVGCSLKERAKTAKGAGVMAV